MLTPEDIANRALDMLGVSNIVGDMQEGTTEARALLRNYMPTVQDVLRAANWNCARLQADLTLLQDQTGNSDAPVGTGTPGMGPWVYEYAWPPDCMKARYVTGSLTVGAPIPITTFSPAIPFVRAAPAPFLVTNDLIPNLTGAITNWNQMPDFDNAQGQGLTSQTVILTNVPQAQLVYTSRIVEPNVWDPMLQSAIAAVLAARVAMAVIPDKKFAMVMQKQVIAIARTSIEQARIADGNEGPSSVNREASWMAVRNTHNYWNNWSGYGGPGVMWYGWDSIGFPDGSSF